MKMNTLMDIYNELSEYTWKPCADLATRLRISPRTVIRYMNELETAFSPLPIIDRGPEGYKKVKNDFFDNMRRQADHESLAAIVNTPLGGLFRPLKPYSEDMLNRIKDIVDIRGKAPDELLRDVFKTMMNGLYVELLYQKKQGEEKKHVCAPIRIVLNFSMLYLIVYDDEHGCMITMNMNKIAGLKALGSKLNAALLNECRAYLRSAWGTMIQHDRKRVLDARFEAGENVRSYFEKSPLHETQKIDKSGGKCVVSLKVHHPTEFVRWALRFGESITILGPDELKDEMRKFLDDMRKRY